MQCLRLLDRDEPEFSHISFTEDVPAHESYTSAIIDRARALLDGECWMSSRTTQSCVSSIVNWLQSTARILNPLVRVILPMLLA